MRRVAGLVVAVGVLGVAVLATAITMSVLAWRRGVTGTRLVLVGIALTAILTAGTQHLLTRSDIDDVSQATGWLTAMRDGAIVSEGPPQEVVTEQLVADVFGLATRIITDPVSGTPLVVPIGARHRLTARPAGAGVVRGSPRTGPSG